MTGDLGVSRAMAPTARETHRARLPDECGHVAHDGVRVAWERYGDSGPTVFLLPVWAVAPGRIWKAQAPYLARHFRVLTCDPRGHGASDRPSSPEAHDEERVLADLVAVLDATGTERAVVVGLSLGARHAMRLAADHPDRVAGVVAIAPSVTMSRWRPGSLLWRMPIALFHQRPLSRRWLLRFNAHEIRRDRVDWVRWAAGIWFNEPHSTRQIEQSIEWAAEADAEQIVMSVGAPRRRSRRYHAALARNVRCPVLVIHGTDDAWIPHADGRLLARATGGRLVSVPGAGHGVAGRWPVAVNLAIREFVEGLSA